MLQSGADLAPPVRHRARGATLALLEAIGKLPMTDFMEMAGIICMEIQLDLLLCCQGTVC